MRKNVDAADDGRIDIAILQRLHRQVERHK